MTTDIPAIPNSPRHQATTLCLHQQPFERQSRWQWPCRPRTPRDQKKQQPTTSRTAKRLGDQSPKQRKIEFVHPELMVFTMRSNKDTSPKVCTRDPETKTTATHIAGRLSLGRRRRRHEAGTLPNRCPVLRAPTTAAYQNPY